ncbi:MAG: formate--tetrahydrofolate ligase [Vicinamibacterales bacterium]
MRRIEDVAADLGLSASELHPWGPGVAKIDPAAAFRDEPSRGRLVLVSAINPTPAGEGKTTCVIGLTQAARRLGARAACALREPSLGPIFGAKGGGTGGGRSTLEPSERINLHFTGDLHAVTAANNLLAALADNEVYFETPSRLDSRQIAIRRVMDMNDRFLRHTVSGLGGRTMGVPREAGFDITAASEVMAILCLADGYADLKARLGRMLVGFGRTGTPVHAADLHAQGAMAALLRDALLPNLVQTTEGAPALVHGGPFGNIAHGCNSIIATRLLLRRADVVFTEAGFGFDLGAEKFLDIKCRAAGFWPHAVVLVVTVRALKFHGGVRPADAARPDGAALARGMENLDKHLDSVRQFGLEPLVMVNVRADDPPDEVRFVVDHLTAEGVQAAAAEVYAQGGAGALAIAEMVLASARAADAEPKPRFMYELTDSPMEKVRRVARAIYGAEDVDFSVTAKKQLDQAVTLGLGQLPICIAKTHLSLSDDDKRIGRPRDFEMTVREVRVAAGAGFLVPLTGDITTMPGLPRRPHAADIDLQPDGTIVGVL